MVWVEVAGRFLRHCADPTKELQRLLLLPFLPSDPVEAKMSQLYCSVLLSCPWATKDFEVDYEIVMGTILTLKRPLPTTGVVSLAASKSADNTLRSILLTGIVTDDGEKLVLHDSFRDFAVRQTAAAASLSDAEKRYLIGQRGHDARIAQSALGVINTQFPVIAPALDNIVVMLKEHKGDHIPRPPDGAVSDVLWYSCQFFVAHLKAVTKPSTALKDALRVLLKKHVYLWMKLCASMDDFQGVEELLTWCSVCFRNHIRSCTRTDLVLVLCRK